MSERMATIPTAELARLQAIEEAARWHLAHSACRGWEQGEVLALALGLDPEAFRREFDRVLDLLGIPHENDPLRDLLNDEGNGRDGAPS